MVIKINSSMRPKKSSQKSVKSDLSLDLKPIDLADSSLVQLSMSCDIVEQGTNRLGLYRNKNVHNFMPNSCDA